MRWPFAIVHPSGIFAPWDLLIAPHARAQAACEYQLPAVGPPSPSSSSSNRVPASR
jgi:hypothetical protein